MLMNLNVLTAAALNGVDLAANDRNNVSSRPRVIRAIGVAGSVAAHDFWVEVFIGNYYVGTFYNTQFGVVEIGMNADMIPVGNKYVPAGDKISVIAGVNAGAGNVRIIIL